MANANLNSGNGWTPEELALIKADSMDEDVFADRIFEQIKGAPALIEKQQIYTIEDSIKSDQMRRVALALAAMPGGELIQKIDSDREFAVLSGGIFSEMDQLIARYKGLLEVIETVQARLMVSLANREDMESVINEGKATLFAD